MESDTTLRVCGIGRIVVDHVVQVDAYPERDTKHRARDHWFQVGGPVPTALAAAIKLGHHDAAFMGKWGADLHGEWIAEDLGERGIDYAACTLDAHAHTAFAHIWVDPEGRRTIAYTRGEFDRYTAADLDPGWLTDCEVLHLDGEHAGLAVAAARQVKAQGGLVVMDGGSAKPGDEELLPLVDVFIASAQCCKDRLGDTDPETCCQKFAALGIPRVCATRGEQGAWLLDNGTFIHQPAFEVEAVDTNGAGDVFCGALIHQLLVDAPGPDALRFACAAAALKAKRHGNREAIPDAGRLQRFLDHAVAAR